MEELKVVVNQQTGIIDFSNFDELKGQLSAYLEEYRYSSYTEGSKGFAKATVAELRKLKKAVNDRKIEVKKAYIQPLDEFEGKTKELLALIDEPILLIDGQIKEFDQKRIEARREEIRGIYTDLIEDMEEYAPFSRLYSAKWENASTSLKKIREDMEQQIFGIRMDLESLTLMRVAPDVINYALDQYRNGSSAVEAMRKANQFAELLDQREKQQLVAPAPAVEIPLSIPELEDDFDMPFETPSAKKVVYHVIASAEKLEMLEAYMNSFGISYERMD